VNTGGTKVKAVSSVVSGQEPQDISDPGTDLEYDLAHETDRGTAPAAPPRHEPVVTATPEYEGDYSYDLAHDVPRPTKD
jgi:hypothetical protein